MVRGQQQPAYQAFPELLAEQMRPGPDEMSRLGESRIGARTGASSIIASRVSSSARSIFTATSRQSPSQRSRWVSPTGWNTAARAGVACSAWALPCRHTMRPEIGRST
jgi:hypothetical protein